VTLNPRVSIVVPVYNEGESITEQLDKIFGSVSLTQEVLVVYDFPEDSTVPALTRYAEGESRLRPLLNTYGRGPAKAIRFGFDHAQAPVIAVTMADGSDDVRQIDDLVRLVEDGAAVAAASRYARGGKQIGGPLLKRLLSHLAGLSLFWIGRVGTRDATNSFKAYSKNFVQRVRVDSDAGFEIGIELVAKARRLRLPVEEIPTVWTDRQTGRSNFQLFRWIPSYLRWYLYALRARPVIARRRSRDA
jgi:dolichol-phosphate mannosyltransferase